MFQPVDGHVTQCNTEEKKERFIPIEIDKDSQAQSVGNPKNEVQVVAR